MDDILIRILSALILICFSAVANSGDIKDSPIFRSQIDFTYESIELPEKEKMGLLGGSYLIGLPYNFRSGLGIYGAVDGDRGGFFTGGLETQWQTAIFKQTYFAGNLFFGGGGGGAAPQGGGLMLRVALQVGLRQSSHAYGLGLSYVSFPNGEIESWQPLLSYQYHFTSMHFPGWENESHLIKRWNKLLLDRSKRTPESFSLQVLSYFPKSSTLGRSGKPLSNRLDTLGVRWSRQLSEKVWLEGETAGAFAGGIDGFAQVLGGTSYRLPLTRFVNWQSGVMFGAAGGGDVDSGGGLIFRLYTGAGLLITKKWSIDVLLGWQDAPMGDFQALTSQLNMTYHFSQLGIESGVKHSFAAEEVKWHRFRIRAGIQNYNNLDYPSRKFNSTNNEDINLVSLKLDAFLNRQFFLSGHAIGAFTGGAGGYAVGLVGPGIQFNTNISSELLVGVAGGGGLDVGNGQLVQPMINYEIPLSNSSGLEFSIGYIKAVNGRLDGYVGNFSFVYRFSQPYL